MVSNFNSGGGLFGKKTLPQKSPLTLRFVLPNHGEDEVENEPEVEDDEYAYDSTGMCCVFSVLTFLPIINQNHRLGRQCQLI